MNQSKSNNTFSANAAPLAAGAVIPPPTPEPFMGAISHPDLYLWDVWSAQQAGDIHLYCLAVSRTDMNGNVFPPADRNLARFHIRHFLSVDAGRSWQDRGCFQQPRVGHNTFDSRTIWSGSILPLADGRKLAGYTGIREADGNLLFQQSLALAVSNDWDQLVPGSHQLLSDPLSDWQTITDQGYYLGEVNSLGHKDGEADGPILAWRDPFFIQHDEQLHMYWGAKMGNGAAALGHAIVAETDSDFVLDQLLPPTAMPDGDLYTQLELPKVMFDDKSERFLLIIGSCNRLHERQSDAEADKQVRMYQSNSLDGPWQPHGHRGSTLDLAEPHMFGITVIDANFDDRKLHYVAPYTEQAGEEKFLTLSPTYSLDLDELG